MASIGNLDKASLEDGWINVTRGTERIVLLPEDYEDFAFKDGDVLSVEPAEVPRHRTPDGDIHLLAGPARPIRVPGVAKLCDVKGYQMPFNLVLLTGAGPDSWDTIGRAHVSNYEKFMGLSEGMTLLEIGCGIGRDAMQLIERVPPIGRYIGVDVTRDSILWCQKNITTAHPNFTFHHFDAEHELYNPLGSKTSLDFSLPAEDASVDRISLGSVFTHLFEDEVTHYMKEVRRVLRPDGVAYATFFLYSDEIIEAARRTKLSTNGLMFEHKHGDGCYISDAAYPTGSVAFTDEAMQRMMAAAGLKLTRPYLRGWWSGFYEEADDGQEVALLTPI